VSEADHAVDSGAIGDLPDRRFKLLQQAVGKPQSRWLTRAASLREVGTG
jgi:hypothetical protein